MGGLPTGTNIDLTDYLALERAIDPRTARLLGLEYDEAAGGIRLPVEDRVKFRRWAPDWQRRPEATTTPPKMWWGAYPDEGAPLPPYPSWRDLRGCEVIVEGELDAAAAISNGILAASGTAGAGTWTQEWTDAVTGRDLVLLYDNDDAGAVGARHAADRLVKAGCLVRIAHWPKDKPRGYDVTDHYRDGGTSWALLDIVRAADAYYPELAGDSPILRRAGYTL